MRCKVPLVDQAGDVDASPPCFVGGTLRFSLLGRWVTARAKSRAFEAAFERAGPIVPVAQASGYTHVRGRARLLSPVKDPFGESLGAFLARKSVGAGGRELVHRPEVGVAINVPGASYSWSRPASYEMEHVHYGSTIEESSRCGRFAVEDESGVAIVDEDAVEVWVTPRWDAPEERSFCVGVREGEVVEIMGPGAHRPAEDDEVRGRKSSYRTDARVFAFDGRPHERVWVLATPLR